MKSNRNAVALASMGIVGFGAWKLNKWFDQIAFALAVCEPKFQTPFFHVGIMNNPKYDKRWKGGEDACVVSTNQRMIMVADGVGGWTKKDVDPGKYSKFLCKHIGKVYDETPDLSLKETLIEGVKSNPNGGSTTACLAKLEEGGKMKTCNLGDSGYLLLRADGKGNLEKVFRSTA